MYVLVQMGKAILSRVGNGLWTWRLGGGRSVDHLQHMWWPTEGPTWGSLWYSLYDLQTIHFGNAYNTSPYLLCHSKGTSSAQVGTSVQFLRDQIFFSPKFNELLPGCNDFSVQL